LKEQLPSLEGLGVGISMYDMDIIPTKKPGQILDRVFKISTKQIIV